MDKNELRRLAGLPLVESELTEGKKFIASVDVKKHPPEDLFAKGSKAAIVKWLKSSHDDLKSAMGSLSFEINRAGKNMPAEQKAKLEDCKEALCKAFDVKENYELRKLAGLPLLAEAVSPYFVTFEWENGEGDCQGSSYNVRATDEENAEEVAIAKAKKEAQWKQFNPKTEEFDLPWDPSKGKFTVMDVKKGRGIVEQAGGDWFIKCANGKQHGPFASKEEAEASHEEWMKKHPNQDGGGVKFIKEDEDDEEAEAKGAGKEEAEELPKIVTAIAKKAEGKDVEELEKLIGKVYDAGFKDGHKEAAGDEEEVTESKMKELDMDLKAMSDKEFKAKYKMTKAECKDKCKPAMKTLESAEGLLEDWQQIEKAMSKVNTSRVGKPCMTPKGEGKIHSEIMTPLKGGADPKAGPYEHTITVKFGDNSKAVFPAKQVKLFKGQYPKGPMLPKGGSSMAINDAAKAVKAEGGNMGKGAKPKTSGKYLDKA